MITQIAQWTEPDRQGRPLTTRRLRFSGGQPEQMMYMREMVRAYRGTHYIRELANRIVFEESGCPMRARACHAMAIGRWVQANVRYVNEGDETFQTPIRTVELGYGDCDDHAMLIGALLEAIGIDAEIVALKIGPGTFKHVFARARIRRGALGGTVAGDGKPLRIPLDSTLPRPIGTNPITLAAERIGGNVETLTL